MLCIEPARLSDAEAIHALVTFWADKGDMLHRPIGEIYEAIRDFKVARLTATWSARVRSTSWARTWPRCVRSPWPKTSRHGHRCGHRFGLPG